MAREENAARLAGGVMADAPCRRGQRQRLALAPQPKAEVDARVRELLRRRANACSLP
jgi:hypothetical protein